MNEEPNTTELNDEPREQETAPMPMLVCSGEGYITRKDGTIVPFTFSSETA